MKWLAAKATGADHRKYGEGCQDAWALRQRRGVRVLAVADGMGSASHGALGSHLATQAACKGNDLTIPQRMRQARRALEQESRNRGIPMRQLGTTLLVVEQSSHGVMCGQIGDGAIVGWTGTHCVLLSNPGDCGACDLVDPLTSSSWKEAVRLSLTTQRLVALALFTDGLQRAALRRTPTGWIPHEGFFAPLFRHLETATDNAELQRLLEGERLDTHTGDDRTLLLSRL